MEITDKQVDVIDTILCVFETHKLPSDEAYSTVALLGDKAGISYGIHQSTDRSDSLDEILWRYIDMNGEYAFVLQPYLKRLAEDDTAKVDPKNPPPWVKELMVLLSDAGSDPDMQFVQDQVFQERYFAPAANAHDAMLMETALSLLVIYDSYIQGGFSTVRRRFPEVPPSRGGDEATWVKAYLKARREWLSSSSKKAVRNSVYRVDEMLRLIDEGRWNIKPPFKVRGLTIT